MIEIMALFLKKMFIYLYFWLCWVFGYATHGLSLVAVNRGYFSLCISLVHGLLIAVTSLAACGLSSAAPGL